MVWTGISSNRKAQLILFRNEHVNAQTYLDNVLRPVVVPLAQEIGENFILVDDNARPHRAKGVNRYLQEQGITRMNWPACSPDMNPIEHVWDKLQRQLHMRLSCPDNLEQLAEALTEEWASLPQDFILNLIRSMKRRCESLIRSSGGPTSY